MPHLFHTLCQGGSNHPCSNISRHCSEKCTSKYLLPKHICNR